MKSRPTPLACREKKLLRYPGSGAGWRNARALVQRTQVGAGVRRDPAAGGEIFEIEADGAGRPLDAERPQRAEERMVKRCGSMAVSTAEATGTSTRRGRSAPRPRPARSARPIARSSGVRDLGVAVAGRPPPAALPGLPFEGCEEVHPVAAAGGDPASDPERNSVVVLVSRGQIRDQVGREPERNVRPPGVRRRRLGGPVWISSPASAIVAPRDCAPRTGAGGPPVSSVRAGARLPDRHAGLR